MTNIHVVENKISEVRKYLKILERYKQNSQEEIQDDITLLGAVERYLYLVIQATIDTAEALIALRSFRKPKTYGESFEILREENIIQADLVKRLIPMVGFRNIISHDYTDIDFDIVYNVLQHKLSDIEEFLGQVEGQL